MTVAKGIGKLAKSEANWTAVAELSERSCSNWPFSCHHKFASYLAALGETCQFGQQQLANCGGTDCFGVAAARRD